MLFRLKNAMYMETIIPVYARSVRPSICVQLKQINGDCWGCYTLNIFLLLHIVVGGPDWAVARPIITSKIHVVLHQRRLIYLKLGRRALFIQSYILHPRHRLGGVAQLLKGVNVDEYVFLKAPSDV